MKKDAVYFRHILEAISSIEEYTAGGAEDVIFWRNTIAFTRNMGVLDEGSRRSIRWYLCSGDGSGHPLFFGPSS